MGPSPPADDLIDTDVLIDVRRGFPDAVSWFAHYQTGHAIRVSVVTSLELIQGARNAVDQAKTLNFLQQVSEVPLEPGIGTRAHDYLCAFHLSHGLEIPDALIAATAVEKQHRLVTHNLKHFQMIPGLTVVSPY